MQAQAIRTEVQAVTATQSLAAVQTLLKAGLGCITFLRSLLPEENFAESHFTTAVDSALPQSASDASHSSQDDSQGRNVNSFKIKTMTRGYSDEADKLLNYLENGIFDALERQYLRSFIFAIYLDPNDPNNIVEAYTFNFHYHTIPGTNTVVPIMSFGNRLQKTPSRGLGRDPVAEAAMKGKVPTLRDVKRSVKALLKTVIHATSQMDVLPKRRFATFKVFYTEETPVDYEPPHFQAGDAEKDKWFFMTHDVHEVPDRWSIGKLDTGHHSVDVSITSIASYLPSSTEHDDAAFTGTTFRQPPAPSLTPVQEASLRVQQAEKQSRDAEERNVAWSGECAVELHDIDGEGVDDPDYVRQPDGTYERVKSHDLEVDGMVPIGVRNETGAIEPLALSMQMESEAHFGGVLETVPTRLKEVNAPQSAKMFGVEQTQEIGSITQDIDLSQLSLSEDCSGSPSRSSSLNGASWSLPSSAALMSPITSPPPSEGRDADVQMLQDVVIRNDATVDDTEMLDIETQVNSLNVNPHSTDSIESYGRPDATVDNIETDVVTPKPTQNTMDVEVLADNGLQCECSISIHDACCFCEGACGRWYHVWCMGYHSVNDKRIPQKFICFDCRARADVSWELIKTDLYPQMLSKFRQLALFRRAIKIVENTKAETPTEFAKKIGGDNVLARQLFNRLEAEGFISEQSTTINDLGLPETRARGHKSKAKQSKNRKNVQRAKYRFNRVALSSVEYSNYFNPDPDVEARILGLTELKARIKTVRPPLGAPTCQPLQECTEHTQVETQTQDESQIIASLSLSDTAFKRPSTPPDVDQERARKRVKVSVAHAVDLAE